MRLSRNIGDLFLIISKERCMILNVEQQKAVEKGEAVAVTLAGTECVIVRRDVFLRLDPDYDTEPWTMEKMNLLADAAEVIVSQ